MDEDDLVKLMNQCWSEADFGYPIHLGVRIPDTVAETLHIQFVQKMKQGLENGAYNDVQ